MAADSLSGFKSTAFRAENIRNAGKTNRNVEEYVVANPPKIKRDNQLMNKLVYRYTFVPRLILAAMYPLYTFYVTYHLYLATNEKIDLQNVKQRSPGIFTNLTNRGRDSSHQSWTILSQDYFGKCYLWYIVYAIATRLVQMFAPKTLPAFSALLSIAFLLRLIGSLPIFYQLFQIIIFWLVRRLNSKIAIWLTALSCMMVGRRIRFYGILFSDSGYEESYYFLLINGWNVLRCVSFYHDTWERPRNTSLSSLATCIQYCFYFPTTVWGPLEYYERYETHLLLPSSTRKSKDIVRKEFVTMVTKLIRFMFWGAFNEFIMHFLYFQMLSNMPRTLETLSFPALGGVLFWLGSFIQLRYVVLYGIPGAIAEADGMPSLPLPNCITCVHRYSTMWRNIDRGMYNWFNRYCYKPTIELIGRMDKNGKIKPEFRRILAALPSFVFIIAWHGGRHSLFIWAVVNYLGIGLERLGSYLKRNIDERYSVPPAVWDVLIEPIVTIPLVFISWINSPFFSSSAATARLIAYRFFFEEAHMLVWIIFWQTHLGVLVRTWDQVCSIVFCTKRGNKTQND